MTSNKELTPVEKQVYVYKSTDGLLLLAAGRIGDACFANSLDLNKVATEEVEAKVDRLVRGIANSLDLCEKTGWDGVSDLPAELPPKPETIAYPVEEIVSDDIIRDNNVGEPNPEPTE